MSAAPTHHLVLGGARSGKSAYGEALALGLAKRPTYIATSRTWDDKHRARIDQHRARRGERWDCIEEPLALAETLARVQGPCLVDCLSLWVTNLMFDDLDDSAIEARAAAVCALLPTLKASVIFVSNEVGMGVHPETALGNRFRDLAGLVNQQFAAAVDRVDFVIAGQPLSLKK